jgi:hypothetical protein
MPPHSSRVRIGSKGERMVFLCNKKEEPFELLFLFLSL